MKRNILEVYYHKRQKNKNIYFPPNTFLYYSNKILQIMHSFTYPRAQKFSRYNEELRAT